MLFFSSLIYSWILSPKAEKLNLMACKKGVESGLGMKVEVSASLLVTLKSGLTNFEIILIKL